MKYEIISRTLTTELVSVVNLYLSAGWRLCGCVTFENGEFHQVMIKKESKSGQGST